MVKKTQTMTFIWTTGKNISKESCPRHCTNPLTTNLALYQFAPLYSAFLQMSIYSLWALHQTVEVLIPMYLYHLELSTIDFCHSGQSGDHLASANVVSLSPVIIAYI